METKGFFQFKIIITVLVSSRLSYQWVSQSPERETLVTRVKVLSDSFEYLCYGCTAIIHILLFQWEDRTERVKMIHCFKSFYPSKHETFVKHLYNFGPTSETLGQHCTNVIQMVCVCWDRMWFITVDRHSLPRAHTTKPIFCDGCVTNQGPYSRTLKSY